MEGLSPSPSPSPSPRRLERVGLTLSGGGFSGAGAIVGFSCALDVFLGSHGLTQLASYSGVSAGAIVSAYLAAGISPLEIVYSEFNPGKSSFRSVRRRDLYQLNWREYRDSLTRFGRAGLGSLGRLVRRDPKVGEALREAFQHLPSGVLSNARLAQMVRDNLVHFASNDFRALPCRLRVVFYDLLTNQRIVAGTGPGELGDLPISEAVTASAAIPGVFTPRRIEHQDRTLLGVDGGTAGVTLEMRGADELDVLFAYNHVGYLGPVDQGHHSALSVLNLSRQLLLNQRNRDEVANYMDTHPTRHVWMFESPPEPFVDMLSHTAMMAAIGLTFERTRAWLRRNLDYFGLFLEGHGVRINPDFSRVTLDDIRAEGRAVKS
jgi:NTE family protein